MIAYNTIYNLTNQKGKRCIMRKFKVALILSSVSLVMNYSFAADRVVATYNGKEVLKSQIESNLKAIMNGSLPNNKKDLDDLDKNLKQRIITEYVNQEIIADKARAADIQKTDIYKKQMQIVQEQIAINIFLDNYAKRHLTDSAIRSEYNAYVKALKEHDELKVSHILVQSEDEAKKLYKEIKGGKVTFDQAARDNSLDGSKTNGGELGYISKGQTVPEFEQKAYALKKDEVSEPVKTQFGWHILKVTEIRKRKIPSFDEAKATIEQATLMKIQQKYVADIVKDSKVQIF